MRRPRFAAAGAALLAASLSCAHPAAPPAPPPTAPAATPQPAGLASAASPADPLGPRPVPPPPAAFVPPSPAVFSTPRGLTVWLLERRGVPVVACEMAVPAGAASDPRDKAGLARATVKMLQEGAGTRGALDLARALDGLGVRLRTDADSDASFVSMAVLKRHLREAFALFADVVARPRFEAGELARMKGLWADELLERDEDAEATARVVSRVALFGSEHPYGHPVEGFAATVRSFAVEDLRRFYAAEWRPDRATLVCAGDVGRDELAPMVDEAFAAWRAPSTPAPASPAPAAPRGPRPKLVLVDRPDAPQSIVAVVRPGPPASSPDAPALARVDDAIGGSFTSRLNEDLREKQGLTYGASTRVSASRGQGVVVAWSAAAADKTGEALASMLVDLRQFAAGGLTPEEVERTRSQARTALIDAYESAEGIAELLAADAALGLGPEHEAAAARARDEATPAQLAELARRWFAPQDALLVVVGPRARVQPQLEKAGLPAPQLRDASGDVIRRGN